MVKYSINTPAGGDHDSNLKESVFLLTVSTNKRPTDVGDAHSRAALLESVLTETFAEDNIDKFVIVMGSGDLDALEDVDILVAPELGQGRGGAIHAHVVVNIKHHEKIHLDLEWIRGTLTEELVGVQGIKNIHLDLKVMKGGILAILNYARKQY